jgi:hypothetical protein
MEAGYVLCCSSLPKHSTSTKTNPFYAISQNYAQFIDIGRTQRSKLRESSHLLTLLPHIANIDDTPKTLPSNRRSRQGHRLFPASVPEKQAKGAPHC